MAEKSDRWALAFMAGLFALHAVWLFDPAYLPVDDAYITFRYSRNIVDGWGMAYNGGDVRVDGVNNYLWVLFGIPFEALGWNAPFIALLAGWASSLLSGWLVVQMLPREMGRARWLAGFLLVLWAQPAIWSMGGLETATYGLFILLIARLYANPPRTTWSLAGSASVLTALPLLRPEGILISIACAAWLGARAWRQRQFALATPVVFFLLSYGAFVVWRFYYFSFPYPNTYYVKMATLPTADRWVEGVRYLIRFFNETGAWVLIPFWLIALSRRTLGQALTLAIGLGSVMHMGGDWMPHFRFCTPLIPLMVLLAFQGVFRLVEAHGRAARVAVALSCLLVVIRSAPASVNFKAQPITWLGWHRPTAHWLARNAPPGTRVFLHDVGALPYYASNLVVLDGGRLTDVFLAHRQDLNAADYLLAQQPELVIASLVHPPGPDDPRLTNYVPVEDHNLVLRLPHDLAAWFPESQGTRLLFIRRDLIGPDGQPLWNSRPLRRATAGEVSLANAKYDQAMAAWRGNDLDSAIRLLEEARRLWPASAWSYHRLEQIKLQQRCREKSADVKIGHAVCNSWRLPGDPACE
jgi:hypothetical protein